MLKCYLGIMGIDQALRCYLGEMLTCFGFPQQNAMHLSTYSNAFNLLQLVFG